MSNVGDWPINPVDLAVIVILLLSAFLAFVRGFVLEVLSVISWIGAAAVAYYLFPAALPYVERYITQDLAARIATGAGLFVIALTILSLIGHFVAKAVKGPALGAVNRSLGFLFGLARGALLICLAYLMLIWLLPDEDQRPQWVAEARTRPLIEQGTALLQAALPAELSRQADRARERASRAADPASVITGTPRPNAGPADQSPTYDSDRLQQLLNSQQP